jgi:hypothetical protein
VQRPGSSTLPTAVVASARASGAAAGVGDEGEKRVEGGGG